MLTKTDIPITFRFKIRKEDLRASLEQSYAKYSPLYGFEEHPGIKYKFGILKHKDDNIVIMVQTPLEPPITTIDIDFKISIPSTNFSFRIVQEYKSGSGPYGKVVCSYRELFDPAHNYFVDDVLTVTLDGVLSYLYVPKFSCGVCFDEYPVTEKILCGFDDYGAVTEKHSFCQGCLVEHARAATEGAQLGDDGFRCMEYECKNSIVYSPYIQNLLPQDIKKRIDERIREENLAKSKLDLEECRDCNLRVEMVHSKEQNMVFPCPQCKKEWCRLCEREWNDEHHNFSCAELDAKQDAETKQRELERRLNEAVVRKCECGLQFMKLDQCNKMTCRCGIKQCYLCHEKNIEYNHFCQHDLPPGGVACQHCGPKCTLWGDADVLDQTVIDGIKAEAAAKDGINLL